MSKKRNAVVLRNELHIDKMRALRIICLAAIFPSILAIPFNDKNYQVSTGTSNSAEIIKLNNETETNNRASNGKLYTLYLINSKPFLSGLSHLNYLFQLLLVILAYLFSRFDLIFLIRIPEKNGDIPFLLNL